MRPSKKRASSEHSEIVDETGEQHKEADPTQEMMEWAKARTAVLSESTPGVMGPREGFMLDEEATGPKQKPMILVVTLDSDAAQEGQAHLFEDRDEASRFIETVVGNGLDAGRVLVFQGAPMRLNVSYRPVAVIE